MSTAPMSEVYVFLGPTLDEKDARAELDAVYLPPVSAGDVCRLWSRRPRVIGIVDGYFDRVPAVWHKEILWMMERGVHVFGGGGLGALRAAELDAFGMRGVGWVYRAFRDGKLNRDDEVAVERGSESMVNIRRTLRAAQDQGVISAATSAVLTATGTALFYPERTWSALFSTGGAAGVDAAELDALRRWLPRGRIDQQAADAVAMLREIRGFLAAGPGPQQVSWTTARTAMWEAARRHAGTTQDDDALAGLIFDEIRLLGPGAFDAARCHALLQVFAADFAEREGMTVDGEAAIAEFQVSRGLDQPAELARFLAANDLSADELQQLVVTHEMARWACGQAYPRLLDDLRLHGEYAQLAAKAKAKAKAMANAKAGAEVEAGSDADPGLAALGWYFRQRHGMAVPEDLAGYARACGFPDEQAFRTAVRHEYQYTERR
jgi:hypothetical protein